MNMEASEIVRRNEAIARFMGWAYVEESEEQWAGYKANGMEREFYMVGSLCFHTEWSWTMPVVEKISLDAEVSLTFRPMGQNLNPLCYASAGQKSKHSYMDGNLSPIETVWRAVSDYCLAL